MDPVVAKALEVLGRHLNALETEHARQLKGARAALDELLKATQTKQ